MDPFLGEIKMVGFNFAPRGYALCNGQLMPISQNSALFSLLGTTYGGDGVQTYGLPNLQGRVPMHWGNGAGLSPRVIGELAGTENVSLLATQMPAHNHLVAVNATAGVATPTGNFIAGQARGGTNNFAATTDNSNMNAAAILPAGGGQPHSNLQPFLCVTFIIATTGIFPSRN